jgi:hypothetical protein
MWRSFVNATVLVFLFFPTLSAQDLAAGHVEVRFLGGANYSYTGSGRAASPSYSIEGAFGLSRFVALTPQVSFRGGEITRFSVAPGLGLDVTLTRHFGIAIDARAVKAIDFHWFYRTMGGVLVRF